MSKNQRDNSPEVEFDTEYEGKIIEGTIIDEHPNAPSLREIAEMDDNSFAVEYPGRWYDDYDANPEMSLDLIKDLYGPSKTRSTPNPTTTK